jgi:hypothetical protein
MNEWGAQEGCRTLVDLDQTWRRSASASMPLIHNAAAWSTGLAVRCGYESYVNHDQRGWYKAAYLTSLTCARSDGYRVTPSVQRDGLHVNAAQQQGASPQREPSASRTHAKTEVLSAVFFLLTS